MHRRIRLRVDGVIAPPRGPGVIDLFAVNGISVSVAQCHRRTVSGTSGSSQPGTALEIISLITVAGSPLSGALVRFVNTTMRVPSDSRRAAWLM